MNTIFKKKWFWVVMVIVAFGGWKYYQAKTALPTYQTEQVRRGTVTQTVSVSSTLLADTEVRLNFETGGRIKEILTTVGKQVGVGDILARLDVAELNAGLSRAQAEVDRAEAAAGLSDESLREAREAVKGAKSYLDAVEDAEDQKVDAADNAYEDAQDYENDAQSYYDKEVADHGSDSAEVKSAKLTLTTATNSRKAADEAKETAQNNRDVAVQLAKNTWDTDKEHVKTLESKSQVASNNSAVAEARANYSIALNNLEQAELKAPVNGTVTQLNYKKGEVLGSMTGTGSFEPFGRLLSLDFVLEAKIPESDISKVRVGQLATVSFDALPSNDRLQAQIIEIDPESTVIQDVVYYKAKLKLASNDVRLKAGMSADIDIHVAEQQNVLMLPNRAVKRDGDKRYIETIAADKRTLERHDVQTGLEGDETQVEIKTGVTEGETVVVK